MFKKFVSSSVLFCLFLTTGHSFEIQYPEEITNLPTLLLRVDEDIHSWKFKNPSLLEKGSKEEILTLESMTDQTFFKEICLYKSENEILTLAVISYRDEPKLQNILKKYRHPSESQHWICENRQEMRDFLRLLRNESLIPKKVLDVLLFISGVDKRAIEFGQRFIKNDLN